jgi:hypothetical protein
VFVTDHVSHTALQYCSERVQQNLVAAGRLERAKIVVEVEDTTLRPVGNSNPLALNGWLYRG